MTVQSALPLSTSTWSAPPARLATQGPRFKLRDYQLEAIAAIDEAEARGIRRPLAVLATGSGKTILFSELARRRGARALILAHRDELIRQAADKFQMVAPSVRVGVVKAEEDDVHAPVVVASVQTLAQPRRLRRLAGVPWRTIIVDEAHHATGKNTYGRVLTGLGCLSDDGPLTLGVTATPERSDGEGLGAVWQEIVYRKTILDLILAGYLVDLKAVQVRLALDAGKLHVRAGDFIDSELEDALLEANAPQHAVTAYLTHGPGRKALLFTPTVRVAYRMAQAFRDAGVTAEAIDGSLNPTERRAILGRFSRGETMVLANAQLLTEGYDEPSVDCVIVARPTRSRPFYIQQIGRATRLHPGKEDALIIDLVGASTRHDLMTAAILFDLSDEDLEDESVTEAIARKASLKQPEKLAPVGGELVAARVDLFRRRPLHWIQLDGQARQFVLPLGDGWLGMESAGDVWSVVRHGRDEPPQVLADGLTLEYAQGVAEDRARELGAGALVKPDARWRQEPASEKQLAALLRMRIPIREGLTKGEASDLMTVRLAGRTRR